MSEPIDILCGFAGKGGGEESGAPKKGKFDASILTTFNAYLPFYEDVILRRLVSAGCHHNILLMDAKSLAQSLASPSGRPRLAGRAYTLVPMVAAGAFHPKVALLVGKKRARVFVGSHNATLSGFGHNRELSTLIDIDKGSEGQDAPVAQAVWAFLEAWLNHQKDRLPPSLIDSVQMVATSIAPWLKQQGKQEGEIQFFGTLPDGPSLWEQIQPHLPAQTERVTVLGPFFDMAGSFLDTLGKDLKPNGISVGIEPARVNLCRLDNLPSDLLFHDVTKLGARKGYLHAKALLIEGAKGEAALISGSANPSRPAWTAEPSKRNAEAVVLYRGPGVLLLAEELGLKGISSLAAMDASALADVLKRTVESQQMGENDSLQISSVAEARPEGLFIPYHGLVVEQIKLVTITCSGLETPVETTNCVCQADGVLIQLTNDQVSAATYAEVHLMDGRYIISFVHHPAAIAKLTRTSSQKRFRDALDSLNGESPDLSTVIRLANCLIFDDEELAENTDKALGRQAKADDGETKDKELGPLSVPIGETKHHKKRIRDLQGSDLSYVIDVLIHRLGIGLAEATEQLEDQGPNEEELVNTEEEMEPPPPTLPPIDLIKTCQSKVRTLVSRMKKHLEKTTPENPKAYKVIGQLLAVLAVLREIRAQDLRLALGSGSQSLVPIEQRKQLLDSCLANLFGSKKNLFNVAEQLFEDDPENDLARLLGLIIWLAWDCGLDARVVREFNKWDRETYRESLLDVARLLELATIAGKYDDAFSELHHSAWRTCKDGSKSSASQWVGRFKRWSDAISRLKTTDGQFMPAFEPKPGDLAIAIKEAKTKLRLVLTVETGKIRMAEFGEENNEKKYNVDSISAAKLPVFGG
jgi:hypothetical protein